MLQTMYYRDYPQKDLNSMIPIEKPKSPDDGAENILAMALVPETFKRPNGTFLIDI